MESHENLFLLFYLFTFLLFTFLPLFGTFFNGFDSFHVELLQWGESNLAVVRYLFITLYLLETLLQVR